MTFLARTAPSETTRAPQRPRLRERIEGMEDQRIAQIVSCAADLTDVIPLWFGESDIVTPEFICRAAQHAMAQGHTFYVHRRGLPALRHEAAAYLNRVHGLALDPTRVSVTASGMMAIMTALQCLVESGDNVVVVSPIWPNVQYAIETLGATCRHLRLDLGDDGWSLDLDKLFAACDARTRAIFIATPGNPTGWTATLPEQREILRYCRRQGLWVIADEVYHRFSFACDAAPSFLQSAQPDDALFVVQSFSKSWAMTGWRLGWLVHPGCWGDRIGDLSAINNTGATSFVQHAGVVALREGEPFVREMVQRCERGRDLVFQALSAISAVKVSRPSAGFYCFFSVAGAADDLEFAKQLLTRARVGLAPGSAFGPGNEGYFRICFACGEQRLKTAMTRLEGALASVVEAS